MQWHLQEMRRPAPDAPPGKRPRRECADGAGSGFLELGRFDYRAAEQLAQGAQGFIVTCGFQRCSTLLPPLHWVYAPYTDIRPSTELTSTVCAVHIVQRPSTGSGADLRENVQG